MAVLAWLEPRGPHPVKGRRLLRLTQASGRRLVAGIPLLWLLLLFLIPFLIVFRISFSEVRLAIPPYTPLVSWHHGSPALEIHASAYSFLFTDPLYVSSYLYSLKVAAVSTLCCLLIGYPMAYAIAHARAATRSVLLMLIVLPFWTSFLLRVYSWIGLLKNNGVINNVLLYLGVIHQPLALLQTDFAVYVGIVYSYLPFMILPLYTNLEKHDPTLLEAAADLGARPLRAFLAITLPQSAAGIFAGSLLVFSLSISAFATPKLVGGASAQLMAVAIYEQTLELNDWPFAAAIAAILLAIALAIALVYGRLIDARSVPVR